MMVQAALARLFVSREHASSVLMWKGETTNAPTFGEPTIRRAVGLAQNVRSVDTTVIAVERISIGIPVVWVDLEMLEAHFNANPAGWDAWFRRFPGSAGIVEIVEPSRRDDGTAVLFVGRACGEHCRSVWRLVMSKNSSSAWAVDSIFPLTIPLS